MWPGSRPGAEIVVGYSIELPSEPPTFSQMEALFVRVENMTNRKLTLHAGCAVYESLLEYEEPISVREIFLGICVSSAYGEPDVSTFSWEKVQKERKKLKKLSKKYASLCQELAQEYSFVSENLYDTTTRGCILVFYGR